MNRHLSIDTIDQPSGANRGTATRDEPSDNSETATAPGRPGIARRAAAEGLAAFALVFAGCGAIVTDARYDGALGAVGVSLVFGLVIMVMIYATGHLSGAHINPAVTLAFTLTRHFPAREAAAYIAAQCVARTWERWRCSRSLPTKEHADGARAVRLPA